MKTHSRYKLTVEDEGRIETLASISASPLRWTAVGALVMLLVMALGGLIAFLTPLRQILPGYMKESERAQLQAKLLSLDSLWQVCETNIIYLNNLQEVLTPQVVQGDPSEVPALKMAILQDSLLPTSMEEKHFVSLIREREKYNISVVAPLAAESMMFTPVSEESVVTAASRKALKAEIVMARNTPVAAIADGTVIAVSQSLRDGGAVVIIQHPKGFLSRCSRLGQVLVEPGDVVAGGQIIALTNRGNARNGEIISLEMWHNGNKLVPYEYIGGDEEENPIPLKQLH